MEERALNAFPEMEHQSFMAWASVPAPRSILLIRFHAIGDVAVCLPAAVALRSRYPSARIDFLSMDGASPLASLEGLFDAVIVLPTPSGRISRLKVAASGIRQIPRGSYDVIIDLQRNWVSRNIRRWAGPPAWGEFDRFSPLPAWIRTVQAIRSAGLQISDVPLAIPVSAVAHSRAKSFLVGHGVDLNAPIVVLNPAGLWKTRNWPLDNYVQLCMLWRARSRVQFLIIGTERIRERSTQLKTRVGQSIVDLTGQTSLDQAMEILSCADVMVTEDSGLMHMAWAMAVPIVSLFGSSRHQWSAPWGPASRCLHSADLSCGSCMSPDCIVGDVRCLTRYTAEQVLDEALTLMSRFPRTKTT